MTRISQCARVAFTALCLFAAGAGSHAQTFTTLASFNGTNGSQPDLGSLIQATDGNFYGATSTGGANGAGVVFNITPGGTLTTLYSFLGNSGIPTNPEGTPAGGLLQGADGNFYGTTLGGDNGLATVFKITPAGALTTLHVFGETAGDGSGPQDSLILGSDGNFYGTASAGGVNGSGAVFEITPGGTLTTLYSFGGPDGATPVGSLVQASDGNFYGTTQGGGAYGFGTVFKITPSGTPTLLYSFTGNSDGGTPFAGLVQGTDGNLYGTTAAGGTNASYGTVFKITTGGTLTTLYRFTGVNGDGQIPYAPLIQAADGNFYGTTTGGGTQGVGAIFEMTPAGAVTILHSFSGTDGDNPYGGLVQGKDGRLYGTTYEGGANNEGTVFAFTLASASGTLPSISPGGVVSASAFGEFTSVAPGSWIEIYGSNLATDSRSWAGGDFDGINAPTSLDGTKVTIAGQLAFVDYISPNQVNVQVPSNVPTGSQSMTVTTPAGTSSSYTITVNSAEPGLLAPASFKVGGIQYVAALYFDGATFVLPPGAIAGLPSRRAQPGDTIVLYGVGFGAVTPAIPAGQIVQQTNSLAAPFHLFFGGTEATVSYDGLAPQAIGLYQFNVTVPNIPSSDQVPLTFTLGGAAGTQTLYISVQNGTAAP
jgi:uncharacterized protein (TIGR03437 family)